MIKLDILKEILKEAQPVKTYLKSPDLTEAKSVVESYGHLVDRFYEINQNILAKQQYMTAKVDFDYFLRILELAIEYECSENSGKGAN